jgi:adenine phosphoribosyltransferase
MENPTIRVGIATPDTNDPPFWLRLPLRALPDGALVAYFSVEDKPRLTAAIGRYLATTIRHLEMLPDVVVMPAGKATPLLHATCLSLDEMGISVEVAVAQKRLRAVMRRPVEAYSYTSITSGLQMLYLDADATEKIVGKRVLILDDVVSTGGSIEATKALTLQAGGIVVGVCAVFTEGGDKEGVTALGNLPFPCPAPTD